MMRSGSWDSINQKKEEVAGLAGYLLFLLISPNSASLWRRRRSSWRSNNRDDWQHDIGGVLTIMQNGLVSDS